MKFPAVTVRKIWPGTQSFGVAGGFPSGCGWTGRDDSDEFRSAGKKQSSSRKRSPSFDGGADTDKSVGISIFVRNHR
jgi:hypothetical protein